MENNRNSMAALMALVKKNVVSALESFTNRGPLRVKVDNERVFFSYMDGIKQNLYAIQALLGKMPAQSIQKGSSDLKIQVPSDEKLGEIAQSIKSLTDSQVGKGEKAYSEIMGLLKSLEATTLALSRSKIAFPQTQQVRGEVKVTEMPDGYDFERLRGELLGIRQAISDIKFPAQKDFKFPEMPKQLGITEGKDILAALRALQSEISALPKSYPKTEFPSHINVDNFPVQKYPMPVTNFNLNPLRGYVKTTSVTVSTNLTALPGEILAFRRSIMVFNNDATTTLYIGGANMTAQDGLPVLAQTYSPVMDAGPKMLLYGRAGTGSIDARVIELSNENIGG